MWGLKNARPHAFIRRPDQGRSVRTAPRQGPDEPHPDPDRVNPPPPLRSPDGSTRPDQPEPPRHLADARSPPPPTDHCVIGPPNNEGSQDHHHPQQDPTPGFETTRSAACPVTSSSKATSPETPTAATAKTPARPTPA